MKRLFCLLAALWLVTSCSLTSRQSQLTHPEVVGVTAAATPKNDSIGVDGSVKVAFPQLPLTVQPVSCGVDGESGYLITATVNVDVEQPGALIWSIGLRTSTTEPYRWFIQAGTAVIQKRQYEHQMIFAVRTPATSDIFMKIIVVGGDATDNHSSRHYAEYLPAGGTQSSIPYTQCRMST
ncbi:MAG: hypothetical protein WAS27_03185 [Candidatus Saccharimonadales bacterium]